MQQIVMKGGIRFFLLQYSKILLQYFTTTQKWCYLHGAVSLNKIFWLFVWSLFSCIIYFRVFWIIKIQSYGNLEFGNNSCKNSDVSYSLVIWYIQKIRKFYFYKTTLVDPYFHELNYSGYTWIVIEFLLRVCRHFKGLRGKCQPVNVWNKNIKTIHSLIFKPRLRNKDIKYNGFWMTIQKISTFGWSLNIIVSRATHL